MSVCVKKHNTHLEELVELHTALAYATRCLQNVKVIIDNTNMQANQYYIKARLEACKDEVVKGLKSCSQC